MKLMKVKLYKAFSLLLIILRTFLPQELKIKKGLP
jgi:hypothetical protein